MERIMKTKILVLGLVLATLTTVIVYPTLRGNATNAGQGAATTIKLPENGTKKVEVVFVLDTTGSMEGLIAAAKEKIWSIATTLSQTNSAPEIRMGLVAYRDRGDAYVTQVVDLNKDLDSMYATLMQFAAGGGGDGPESVNQALDDAVTKISWSQDPNSYRVIFLVGDAPPHMDYQGDRKYPDIVAAAVQKGIVVNTIQCGSSSETVGPWTQIAALGHGKYFTVDQAGSAVAIATPFDERIATLAAQLDDTRLSYGTVEEIAVSAAKTAAISEYRMAASPAAQARRGVFNASESGAGNLLSDKDLVRDVESGRVDLATVPEGELPPSLVGKSNEEQVAAIKETAAKREKLQQEIAELARERDTFIEKKLDESGGAKNSLDQKIYDAVREQAADVGLRYESGPKF
jgi:Mg-chelatase subunit ChlD